MLQAFSFRPLGFLVPKTDDEIKFTAQLDIRNTRAQDAPVFHNQLNREIQRSKRQVEQRLSRRQAQLGTIALQHFVVLQVEHMAVVVVGDIATGQGLRLRLFIGDEDIRAQRANIRGVLADPLTDILVDIVDHLPIARSIGSDNAQLSILGIQGGRAHRRRRADSKTHHSPGASPSQGRCQVARPGDQPCHRANCRADRCPGNDAGHSPNQGPAGHFRPGSRQGTGRQQRAAVLMLDRRHRSALVQGAGVEQVIGDFFTRRGIFSPLGALRTCPIQDGNIARLARG